MKNWQEQQTEAKQWRYTNILAVTGILLGIVLIAFLTEKEFVLGDVVKLGSKIVKNTQILTPANNIGVTSDEIIKQVNAEREQQGLSGLSSNDQLQIAAKNKADDLFAKNYWSATAPDGDKWTFVMNAGYHFVYAAMDLARGFTTTSDIVNSWMNSQEDKANILSPHFIDIGIAVKSGVLTGSDTLVVVQILGSKQQALTNNIPSQQTKNDPVGQSPLSPNSGTYQNYGWYPVGKNGQPLQYVNGNWYATPQQGNQQTQQNNTNTQASSDPTITCVLKSGTYQVTQAMCDIWRQEDNYVFRPIPQMPTMAPPPTLYMPQVPNSSINQPMPVSPTNPPYCALVCDSAGGNCHTTSNCP